MPEKNHKKGKKNITNSANSKVKKEIENAVEKIPGILIRQINFNQQEQNTVKDPVKKGETEYLPPHFHFIKKRHPIEKQKYNLLWTGVFCLAFVIIIMWLWNTKMLIYNFSNPNKQEKLWQNTKQNLTEVMNDINGNNELEKALDNKMEKENSEDTIKTTLTDLFSTANAASQANKNNVIYVTSTDSSVSTTATKK